MLVFQFLDFSMLFFLFLGKKAVKVENILRSGIDLSSVPFLFSLADFFHRPICV